MVLTERWALWPQQGYVYFPNVVLTMTEKSSWCEDDLMFTESCELYGKCQDVPEGKRGKLIGIDWPPEPL